MPLDYDALMNTRVADRPTNYADKDVMLYALGLGFGGNPMDEDELPYVFEDRGLKVMPTMASVLTSGDLLADCGWDYSLVVLVEQKLDLYRPLPAKGRMLTDTRVVSVIDKGPDSGALICVESETRLAKDDTALFTVGSTVIARGDGGFGGPPDKGSETHKLPQREPDLGCDLDTRPDQALLFRLCRDRNPLHADPSLARQAGFEKPILHGVEALQLARARVPAPLQPVERGRVPTRSGLRVLEPVGPAPDGDVELGRAPGAALGDDLNHPVGGLGAVERGGRGALDDLDALDVLRANVV